MRRKPRKSRDVQPAIIFVKRNLRGRPKLGVLPYQRPLDGYCVIRVRETGRFGVPLLEEFYLQAAELMRLDMGNNVYAKSAHTAMQICTNLKEMLIDIRRALKVKRNERRAIIRLQPYLSFKKMEDKWCEEDEIRMREERG